MLEHTCKINEYKLYEVSETVYICKTKKEMLDFIKGLSFKDWWQQVRVKYQDKKWYVFYNCLEEE